MLFEKKQTIDLREVRRMLWRRRLVILLPAFVTVAAAGVGMTFMKPHYESVATLAVERPVPLTRTVRAAAGGEGRNEEGEGIRLLRKRILSSSFLESIAVQIGMHEDANLVAKVQDLAKKHPNHAKQDLLLRECVRWLTDMLDIRGDGSDIFYIRSVSSDPKLAFDVARTVAAQYIQTTRQTRLRQSEEAHNFAQEQMAIYEAKLEEKRRQLREYEQNLALKPLSSSPVSAENFSRVNTMIGAVDADLEFLYGQAGAIQARIAEAGLETLVDLERIRSEKLGALKRTLFELERNYALSLVEYEEKETPVVAAENQIAVKSQQILAELESIARLAFPAIEDDARQILVDHTYTQVSIEAARKRKQEFRDFLDKYAADLANVPAEEFRLNRLQEDVQSAERIYQTWLEQANSTQIAKAVQSASVGNQIVLIEPPKLPLLPFAPAKKKILVLSVLMGMALGIGSAVIMEYLDLTLKSVEEIEAVLGVPILGAIPRTQAAVLRDMEVAQKRRVRMIAASIAATVVALGTFGYWYFFLTNGGVG